MSLLDDPFEFMFSRASAKDALHPGTPIGAGEAFGNAPVVPEEWLFPESASDATGDGSSAGDPSHVDLAGPGPGDFAYVDPLPSLSDETASLGTTYDIVIHYSGSATYQSAFTQAEQRWEQIVIGDVPDVNTTAYGLVDDLLIDASIEDIDGPGGILGQAGPDQLRSGSSLPIHGTMRFDTADVAQMVTDGTFGGVILHEMGHVLGIGTIWTTKGLRNDFEYTGANALAEYRTLSGNANATSIPLETGGGSGTAGSHWSEAAFDTELMTGYAERPGVSMPLSRMTAASLRDLGYVVNLSAADPYTLPGGASVRDDYADSFTDTTAPFGSVVVGGSASGNLEVTGDHDWFRVQLAAGVAYTIDERGSDGGSGTLPDPLMRLYNASGQLITSNDDSNGTSDSQILYTPTATGIFYIDAGAYNNESSGTYSIRVTGGQSNHAPVITSNGGGDTAAVLVGENSTAVTVVMAADSDAGQALTYAIVTGAGSPDAASFVLNATTHALSFVTAPNFEAPTDSDHNNSYVLQVRVSDNGSPALSDTQTITVNVGDVQQFQSLALELGAFGATAGGWTTDDRYPRELADVNADGLPDVVGFGDAGVFVSLGTGGGAFGPIAHRLAAFGANDGGWSSDDRSHRELADVNGDGMADIVGFGDAGVFVSLATGGGSFGPIGHRLAAFGTINGGWYSDDRYPRLLGDVNGDHMADIVGFGDAGVFVALATGGGGFGPLSHRLAAFGANDGGWSSDNQSPRELADVNGDGMADIVGFGDAGVFVALATGGGSFGTPDLRLADFGRNAGWSTDDRYPRELADVNGDHKVDIVGFGEAGVSLALGNGDGTFQPLTPDLHAFGPSAGGWTSDDRYPRQLADIDHDGSADIVGFGDAGVWAAFSTGFHLI